MSAQSTPDLPTGQGELFHQSPYASRVEIPIDPQTDMPGPVSGIPEAPMPEPAHPNVNLVDRAEQLQIVTEKLAQINRTRGLAEVLETPQGQRVHKQYSGDAHHILHKAEGIHDRRMIEAKRAFARASGMYAMIESGVMTEDEAKVSTHDDWMEFMKKYADANQPNRLALRRQQKKLVKTLTNPKKK